MLGARAALRFAAWKDSSWSATWPGVSAAAVREVDARLVALSRPEACFVASTLLPSDEVVLFEFLATDEAAVRALADQAGLRCDRLVTAERRTSTDDA